MKHKRMLARIWTGLVILGACFGMLVLPFLIEETNEAIKTVLMFVGAFIVVLITIKAGMYL